VLIDEKVKEIMDDIEAEMPEPDITNSLNMNPNVADKAQAKTIPPDTNNV